MRGTGRATVALTRKGSRYESVSAALQRLEAQIDLSDVRQLLIKPNFVSTGRQLAATHVDVVRAVLDFVGSRYDGRIVVGEGAATSSTHRGFQNYGYEALVDEYGVELVDLNADDTTSVEVRDRRLRSQTVQMARTVSEADYRISIGPPKTHDTVVVTLSIKNMVMGALVNPRRRRSSKRAMHQGYPVINLNLALAAPHVWPQLAVIDGWRGMEGRGPSGGDPVRWRVALAGTDPLAVDVLTARLMGFDADEVGYLHYCRRLGLGVGDLERIEVMGNIDPQEAKSSFTPHPRYQRQLAWQLDGVEEYLRS